LNQLSNTELVQVLESPNGTLRDMAHQLLVTRKDKAVLPELNKMVRQGKLATARLHALCALDGLGQVSSETVLLALKDKHSGVRRHAIRISESIVNQSPEIGKQLLSFVSDQDPQVQMQLAYSLGEWNDPQAGVALAQMALQNDSDGFRRTAILSSAGNNLDAFANAVIQELNGKRPPVQIFNSLVAMAVSANRQNTLAQIYELVGKGAKGKTVAPWKFQTVSVLLNSLARRNQTLPQYYQKSNQKLQSAFDKIQSLFSKARALAVDETASVENRKMAMLLLGRGFNEQEQDLEILAELLSPRNSRQIQSAAVKALAQFGGQRTPQILLERWKNFGPELRSEVLKALISRTAWVKMVLNGIEQKTILASEIDISSRQVLLNHKDSQLRKQAAQLLASSVDSNRAKVIEKYSSVSTIKGNVETGHKIFIKRCSICHQLNKEGKPIGPDLSALTDKSTPALLTAILDPNRAIESKYVSYLAVTVNGLTYNGLLAAESGESITLIQNDGKSVTLLRNELEELQSTGKSLMPEGLEKDMPPQDFADIIAYLSTTKLPRKTFAGNEPALVQPEALRGDYFLIPQNAEIYGASLKFEKKYKNLGYWRSENDRAVWTLNVPQAGKYDVYLEFACPQGPAGNHLLLEAEGQRLPWTVPSTGSWDVYQSRKIGSINLPLGKARLAIRSDGKVQNALFDLKTVRLRVSNK
ncbi:MAG: HEAT repeat domain-containing protein, partial [Gimesia sp.]